MPEENVINNCLMAAQRLAELADRAANEETFEEILDALTDARVAIIRAFPESRRRTGRGIGARGKILEYLLRYQGEWVSGNEIAAISGIGEWARRIRELRLEQGYNIEENRGKYRILSTDPDTGRLKRIQTIKSVRGHDGTPLQRVRELFETLVGENLNLYEINRAARSKEGADLVRRLRSRERYPIETGADAPDLEHDQFRLVSADEGDFLHPAQAIFTQDARKEVFARDDFVCQTCRAKHPAATKPHDEVFYLVILHLDATPDELSSLPVEILQDVSRLATSCNHCAARARS